MPRRAFVPNRLAREVWVSSFGELSKEDVPKALWARMRALKRRGDGQLDGRGGKKLADVLQELDAIAIARYENAAQ